MPIAWVIALGLFPASGPEESGRCEISISQNGIPVACRIHLLDAAGNPLRPPGYPSWKDHFVCDGLAELELPAGRYRLEVERGPEHSAHLEDLAIEAGRTKKVAVQLKRLVDLSEEGWWSGELHVHRPLKDVELLMRAEDLHVAPVITWWNKRNLWSGQELPARLVVPFDRDRFYHVMGGEDEREGGALMYFGLPHPLDIAGSAREYPSPVKYLLEARKSPGVLVDIEKPFWWDVPVWLSTGEIDTMGIAVNHFQRSFMDAKEAWGKPRPSERLPAPLGTGFWCQEIYYHALNCGLRIAPSAGSASGVLANPVGYNRAYVLMEGKPSYEKWIEGLRSGRSFVTNGPLLRVQADGRPPGHVFQSPEPISIELTAALDGRDPVEALEIVRDGKVERTVALGPWRSPGSLGTLDFRSSGWFLVRCISSNPRTFRFASTAPYYVEIGGSARRTSRASAQFFLDWVEERISRIALSDPAQRDEVLGPHRRAREFWKERLKQSNAD